MTGRIFTLVALAAGIVGFAAAPAWAQNIKVTPLGSHDGEFCRLDRAFVFEDPDGTRILYDPGMTVAGPDDPRLGKIDAVLLSSVHGDHLGSSAIPAVNAGTCAKPDTSVKMMPNSNTACKPLPASMRAVSSAVSTMRCTSER